MTSIINKIRKPLASILFGIAYYSLCVIADIVLCVCAGPWYPMSELKKS